MKCRAMAHARLSPYLYTIHIVSDAGAQVCKRTHLDDSNYNYFMHERAFKLRVGAHADNAPLKAANSDARW